MNIKKFLCSLVLVRAVVFFLVLGFFISLTPITFAQDASVKTDGTKSAPSSNVSDTNTTDVALPDLSAKDINAKVTATDNISAIKKDAPSGGTISSEDTLTPTVEKNKSPNPTVSPMNQTNEYANVKKSIAQTDPSTGALVYSYTIAVPPGRNNTQPNLSLQYNSQNLIQDSVFGYGWSMNIPYIQRVNKKGTNTLFTDNYFSSSLSGDLVNVSGGTYASKIEKGDFLKYSFSSNMWTVTDKTGTIYTFGTNTNTRQDDPNNFSHVYKWMLESVQDTNGNFISYTYYKNSSQIYPATITYSNHSASSGIFEIDFLRSSSRSDAMMSAAAGFPSTTNYLINEIDVKVNGTWTSKYVFNYIAGTNTNRSLLSSIIESGQDTNGTVTTLPATSFSYTQGTSGFTPSNQSSTYIPIDTHNGTIPADVNGDGYTDLIQAWNNVDYYYNSAKGIYLYHPSSDNWQLDTSRSVPSDIWIARHDNNGWGDASTKVIDVNGDGLNDMVRNDPYSSWGAQASYLNNGSGWTANPSWNPPFSYPQAVADLNGDGFSDYIKDVSVWPSPVTTSIAWDTGSNFSTYNASVGQTFASPEFLNDQVFADVNGDGLADIIKSTYGVPPAQPSGMFQSVYLNTGTGWVLDSSYTLPSDFIILTRTQNGNVFNREIFQDINGDGLVDILYPYQLGGACGASCTNLKVYINQGHSWVWDINWNTGANLGINDYIDLNPGLLFDANGDGQADILNQGNYFDGITNHITNNVFFNKTTLPVDLLASITLPTGGQTNVTYKMSNHYKDGNGNLLNPSLPLNLPTTYQITTNDGNGNTGTTTYSYQGGSYFFNGSTDRKFAGFNKVIETDPAGNTTATYYHTGIGTDSSHGEYNDDEWKIGQPYRIEKTDSSTNLYSVVVNKWDDYDLGNGNKFVKLTSTTALTYDGTSSHRDTAEEYSYDNVYGNLIQKTSWGEVTANTDGSFTDIGSDKSIENILYIANTGNNVTGLPYDDTVFDQNGAKVNETRNYYDRLALGSVGLGNQTKIEKWLTGITFVNTQKSYDGVYGNVVSLTDENGHVTSYSYDSYHLYPATVTDALNHSVNYLYNYSLGKPKQITDQNGFVYKTEYDGLDRVLVEKVPDLITPSILVTKTAYVYTDIAGAVSIHKTDYLNASNSVDTYQYFDGLGRIIQNRKETETSNNFNVSDYVYNNLGMIQKQSLPYTGTGLVKTFPNTNVSLYTIYIYDPMGRVLNSVNSVGTTSYVYNLWKISVTDPRGKIKDTYSDARGNLIRVDEHNSGSTYTTAYSWNLNGKVKNITDALSNVRNFTYDGLGRRLTAEDLHTPGDTTFGIWTYAYDNAGNMTQSVSPEAKTTNYTFDVLNRMLTENYTGATGTEISYFYDSCTNGISKICGIVMPSGANISYTYDSNGNITSETKTINSNIFVTSYVYDEQGNVTIMTYPDNAQVRYTFNTAGLLNQIERKENAGSFTNVISNIDYSPMNQVAVINYANGTTTTNTYNASQMYRLSNKFTTNGNGISLQNIVYTYDMDNNIIQIIDTSNTSATKNVVYAYDDLNRLVVAFATGVPAGQTPYTQNFTYNAVGNILNKSDVGNYLYQGNTGTNYANPHAATSINSVTNTYDKNGNLLTDGTIINTWNYKNELVQVTKNVNLSNSRSPIAQPVQNSITLVYQYDNAGNRVRMQKGSVNTYYPNNFYNTDGTKKTKSIYIGDQLVATVETVGGVVTPYYVHTDHLGSTNVVSNTTGTSVQLLDYFPFGSQRISSGTYNTQRQYIGQVYDTDTGLDYLNARYYKAGVGQFISQDSMFWQLPQELLLDPQQQNSYSYARDNPVNMKDPSGKIAVLSAIKSFLNSINSFLSKGSTQTVLSGQKTSTSDSGTTLVNYKGNNFLNSTNKVPVDFTKDLNRLNQYAGKNDVKLQIESSGVRIKGDPIPGDVYHKQGEVTENSAHYVGTAVDVNIQYKNNNKDIMCGSSCLNSGFNSLPNPVQGFVGDVRNDSGLRWGGDFNRVDGVHIDNGLYQHNPNEYLRRFNILQN